jgi:Kef-type K+ transport system membrane component KefB
MTNFVIKQHIHEAEFSIALILVLSMAYMTEILGFSSILGAFIAGVLISRVPFADSKSFTDKIHGISFGLFVPLFFVWFGLEINFAEIVKNLWLAIIIFVLYVTIRFSITYIYLKKNKLSAPLTVSASMLSVDVESLVVLMIATTLGIFSDKTPLNLFAPSVLLSTLVIVVLVAIFSKKELKKPVEEKV